MSTKKITAIKPTHSVDLQVGGTNGIIPVSSSVYLRTRQKCTVDDLHPNWRNQELHEDMIVPEEE